MPRCSGLHHTRSTCLIATFMRIRSKDLYFLRALGQISSLLE